MVLLPRLIWIWKQRDLRAPARGLRTGTQAIIKFIWNNKKPRIAKTILSNKRKSGGISILDFKKYYRSIVLKKLHHPNTACSCGTELRFQS